MPTGKTIALLIYPTISHVTATLGIARALREKENRIIYPVFEDLQEFIENHDFIFYRLNNYHFARNNEELSLTGGSIKVILNGLLRRMDMELFNSRKESLLRFYALHQPDYILIDSFLAVDFIMLYNCIGARTKICFLNTMLSTTVFSDKPSLNSIITPKMSIKLKIDYIYRTIRMRILRITEVIRFIGYDNVSLVKRALKQEGLSKQYHLVTIIGF